ncbi:MULTISPECIES: response regulator [unclassified Streptomyces]|uniref:response regulator n=1 Tax=unclassified Streptomyces TaxID=2593676 RepID=UPI00099DF7D0|nr:MULTISPECIES: response regulator [unclassified Streptomyces]MCH0556191.1 response regulator [Streptomyces sp. MUM 16J]
MLRRRDSRPDHAGGPWKNQAISDRPKWNGMKELTALIQALTGLAWPAIVGITLWRLFPTLKEIMRSRGFTVKVGQAELSVQEVSEQVLKATADMQGHLATVMAHQTSEATPPTQILHRILWVDDHPENHAYMAEQLRTLGVTVQTATSTSAANRAISMSSEPFDAIISDMSREEGGTTNRDAGLDLIREVRGQGYETPLFIYASPQQASRISEITDAGGNGATSSFSELFNLLRRVGEFPRHAV